MSLSDIPRTQIEPLLPRPQKIFDGHNDMLYQLWTRGDQKGQLFLDTASAVSYTHLTLPTILLV